MKHIVQSSSCVLLAIFATNCGSPEGTTLEGAAVELATLDSRLQAEDSVLNFDAPESWSATNVTIQSSTKRTEGLASLSVTTSGYATVESTLVNDIDDVTSTVTIDFQSPNPIPWGQVQLFVGIPSLNLTDEWMGHVSVGGLAAGKWHELAFSLPGYVQTALSAANGGVRFKVGLNLPAGSYLLDNGYFLGQDCGQDSSYRINLVDPSGVAPGVLERVECAFYTVYPQLAERFNPLAQQVVDLVFIEPSPYPAYVSGGKIYIKNSALVDDPQGTDIIVHEAVHIIQTGYSGNVPSWIIEGTADFVRDEYGLRNEGAGWALPTGYSEGQHYLNKYGEAAAFFQWIDANYRQDQTPVVDELDDVLRAGSYSDDQTWQAMTGLTLAELWAGYSGRQPPPPATQGVEVCQDHYFGGSCVLLDRGEYPLNDLLWRAIANDSISSVRVPAGYTLRAFTDDWFGGVEVVYTTDQVYVGDALNDEFSSLIVE